MASVVQICNRALQKLGASRITSLTQDSASGRACNNAYDTVLDAELRAHPWNFAIARAQLPADSTPPAWGRQNSFQLPSDFLRLIDPYPELLLNTLDWQIEQTKILTNDTGPLQIRYIARITDPDVYDSLFRECLSSRLAVEICEELTQSNVKKSDLSKEYSMWEAEARRVNAFENVAEVPPEDQWITSRN